MRAPEGLHYSADFLTAPEQSALLDVLESINFDQWKQIRFRGQLAKRRKIAYGWNYDPGDRALTAAPPLPEYLYPLRNRCALEVGVPPQALVQATLTLYPPGAGIGPHKDASYFGNEVVGVSLGSEARIIFRHGKEKYQMQLNPGSLLGVSGPSRSQWTHELSPVAGTRYSIYFRSLLTRD